MSLDHRLRQLEKKMRARLRHQAEIEKIWQWRYQSWRERGWSRLPPPDPALTLDEFKEVWRQAHDPNNRPSRRPRRPPKSADAIDS
jgi:hypothetical protein